MNALLPLALVCLTALGCASPRPDRSPSTGTTFSFDLHGGARRSPAPPEQTFNVGTYNVHWLRDAPAIRANLHRLALVDVWCLQEVRLPDDDADLARAAARVLADVLPAGRWHCAAVAVNRLAELRSGDWETQVIASRFPVESVEQWVLDDGGAKRRVALAATLDVGGHDVLVVNTDHEPSYFAWRDGNGRQVAELVRRLEGVGTPRVVVAGDFNCAGNVFRMSGNAGHVRGVDAQLGRAGLLPVVLRQPTFRHGLLGLRLDRVYTRNLGTPAGRVHPPSSGSDHLPVWCELTCGPN